MALQPASYKLKTISFGPSRRAVRVVIQNENGPCPLLAIANVLLLRNAIQLPAGAPDVTQERLVSLVAGHLLDANSEERLRAASPEYRANVRWRRSPAPPASQRAAAALVAPLSMAGLLRCVGTSAACCCSVRGERRRRPALEPTCSDRARSACCTRPDFHAVRLSACVRRKGAPRTWSQRTRARRQRSTAPGRLGRRGGKGTGLPVGAGASKHCGRHRAPAEAGDWRGRERSVP